MQYFIVLMAGLVAVASAQSPTPMPGGNMMNMNFNLSTPQGILGFLQMENIDPSSLITSNCIANGNPCSLSGGQPCCLSPVFSCQNQGGVNSCLVIPAHVNHIPQIRQIASTAGITTPNPIL